MPLYYMLNKPKGVITAKRDERHKTVMECFPPKVRDLIFPVGRLDKDTEGFLLMTDDGMLSNRLMRPAMHVPKTYFFWALGDVDYGRVSDLGAGAKIYKNSEERTAPAKITFRSEAKLSDIREYLSEDYSKMSVVRANMPVVSGVITITEGKKHQVKRMVRYLGARVVYLKRIQIGALPLDSRLGVGEYRELTAEELLLLEQK